MYRESNMRQCCARRLGQANFGDFAVLLAAWAARAVGTSFASQCQCSARRLSSGACAVSGHAIFQDTGLNLRALVELSTHVSAHSPLLIERREPLAREPLARYWCAHRVRTRLWVRRLAHFREQLAVATPQQGRLVWCRAQPLLADVLAGDLTSRLWGAVLAATDREAGIPWSEPVAASLVSQQQSARRLVLQLLNDGAVASVELLSPLDRMRRRLERWTDVLIGHLVKRYNLDEFAFDPERARDFGAEQLGDSWQPVGSRVWDVYLVSLRSAFPDVRLPGGRLAALRNELSQAMLACFADEFFDEAGLWRSPRARRLLAGGSPTAARETGLPGPIHGVG